MRLSCDLTRSYEQKFQVLKQTNHVLHLAARRPRAVIKFGTSATE
jgi:hypothetical protein